MSTQYYAIFIGASILAVAFAVAQRTRDWRGSGRLLLWCLAASAAGFLIGTPFLLADFQKALSDVSHVREVDIDRAVVGGAFTGVVPYLRILLYDAVGWPVWLAAVVGACWAVLSDGRRALLLVRMNP